MNNYGYINRFFYLVIEWAFRKDVGPNYEMEDSDVRYAIIRVDRAHSTLRGREDFIKTWINDYGGHSEVMVFDSWYASDDDVVVGPFGKLEMVSDFLTRGMEIE